jgi:Ca2+/Na+ antiporter
MTITLLELSISVLPVLGVEDMGMAIRNALGSNMVSMYLILGSAFLITPLISSETYLAVKEDVETI